MVVAVPWRACIGAGCGLGDKRVTTACDHSPAQVLAPPRPVCAVLITLWLALPSLQIAAALGASGLAVGYIARLASQAVAEMEAEEAEERSESNDSKPRW